MLGLQERVEAMKEQLVDNAGVDSLQDRYYSGYIAAFNDVLKAEPEFKEES
jgi:hypothetical protein